MRADVANVGATGGQVLVIERLQHSCRLLGHLGYGRLGAHGLRLDAVADLPGELGILQQQEVRPDYLCLVRPFAVACCQVGQPGPDGGYGAEEPLHLGGGILHPETGDVGQLRDMEVGGADRDTRRGPDPGALDHGNVPEALISSIHRSR